MTAREYFEKIYILPPSCDKNDPEHITKHYQYWRIRIFYSMLIGYAFYYFSRNSYNYVIPFLISELGFTKGQLGLVVSCSSIAYGISKFTSGIMVDRYDCRVLIAAGLLITGCINILFGFCSSLIAFCTLWALNGWFQGLGAPSCAKLLLNWYRQRERGAWWSAWNTSHNIGSSSIGFVAAFVGQHFGWQWAMAVAGSVCILIAVFLLNRVRAQPQDAGLPSMEDFYQERPKQAKVKNEEKLSVKEILLEHVFTNKYIPLLAASYFFVYMIRLGMTGWMVVYLTEMKEYTVFGAAATFAWFEFGGFFGNLAAGWSSDKLFHGRRGPINVLFTLGAILAVYGLWVTPAGFFFWDSFYIFFSGFFIFGPQMMVGMAAAELVDKKAAATANGFVGFFGYAGAACAGAPLAHAVERWGWSGFFVTLTICGLIPLLLLLPTWFLTAKEKMQELAEQKG